MKLRKTISTWAMVVATALFVAGCGSESGDTANATNGSETTSASQTENTASATSGSETMPVKQTAQITIGYIQWAEAVAVTHLMKAILESKLGSEVELRLMNAPALFKGVASGRLDAFLDVWLPNTHEKYWQKYKDQVVDLGIWYAGTATLGIGVPDYVEAQSVADLRGKAEQYNGKIHGIEQGAGIMRLTKNKVIPSYNLADYELTSKGTSAMIAALDKAIAEHRPIAITAWKPHWMFTAYPIRYLKDPKNTLGGKECLHGIVRQGFKEDAPVAYRLLDTFKLNEQQLGTLELAIADARSVYGGVREWMGNHQKLISRWLASAAEGRGGHVY